MNIEKAKILIKISNCINKEDLKQLFNKTEVYDRINVLKSFINEGYGNSKENKKELEIYRALIEKVK
jgi:hypothetical protein